VPDSSAGRQFAWVLEALNGRIEKKIEPHFDPEFLRRVPAEEFRRVVQRWRRDEFGSGPSELAEITRSDSASMDALVYGRVTDRYSRLSIAVDAKGRLCSVSLSPAPDAKPGANATWAGLDAQLGALPGSVALAAVQIGSGGASPKEIHAFGADRALAIASTARLYIAGAVSEEIAAGRLKWDEIITIQDSLKSLPTGRLQLLSEGAEVRLADAFESMLSPGDNTAADHLLFRLGRDRVEAYLRAHSANATKDIPFLSTMELHKLKLTPDRSLAERYIAAGEAERRAMLAPGGSVDLAMISPALLQQWKDPRLIAKVQWLASARDCVALMADVHRLEARPGLEPLGRALRLNPIVPFDTRAWKSIAWAGGSEPGVLSMTWLLERTDGRWYVLTLTWNDPDRPVDAGRLSDLAGAAAALLAKED
jgi:hypothetical protein